ncbi:MAG: ATP-dependent DNA helicase [bacterium]|nr:ATP-dependent DNA helicase [bacterium]
MSDFDFRGANAEQRRAIEATEGPVLILAGPGTGKTFTLVQRTAYLIQKKKVRPEEIMLATFTKKAANELYTRISEELLYRGIKCNLHEMYIGTIHGICLRLIEEHLDESSLRKNFQSIDEVRQQQFVFEHADDLGLASQNMSDSEVWQSARYACTALSRLIEELVTPGELMQVERQNYGWGQVLLRYRNLLNHFNVVDYSCQLAEVREMLSANPALCRRLQGQFRYIMIDEYQDTNCIQESILLTLAAPQNNICVVGDDDQALYSFRGATVQNILQFPRKMGQNNCLVISLRDNYRSPQSIVSLYTYWMSEEYAKAQGWDWSGRRYIKELIAQRPEAESAAAVTVNGMNSHAAWCHELCELVQQLRGNSTITDYNQIAFLFHSTRSSEVQGLIEYFEQQGISVYSPRSDMLFKRREIQLALGCLWMAFYDQVSRFHFGDRELLSYYRGALRQVKELLAEERGAALREIIEITIPAWLVEESPVPCRFSTILFRLFSAEPFRAIMQTELAQGVVASRALRNLSRLLTFAQYYEETYGLERLGPHNLEEHLQRFFMSYIAVLRERVVNEYEDTAEYAPSGCISFLTIHQAKGMEFPVVIVGLPEYQPKPRLSSDPISQAVKIFGKGYRQEAQNDDYLCEFWRLYYTAFSRAQDLLVLTSLHGARPNDWLGDIFERLPDWRDSALQLSKIAFSAIKTPYFKPVFTYTADIGVYDDCPRLYKFRRELGVEPLERRFTCMGLLVHQTLEDVNRSIIKEGLSLQEVREHIDGWLTENYTTLLMAYEGKLTAMERQKAKEQVSRYIDYIGDRWERLYDVERSVSLLKEDYILAGQIDLLVESPEQNGLEIVDFKSSTRPFSDKYRRARTEFYRRQLFLYAHLLRERSGKQINGMHLFYTGTENGDPLLSFAPDAGFEEDTLADVDQTAHRIMAKDFEHTAFSSYSCQYCALKWLCQR